MQMKISLPCACGDAGSWQIMFSRDGSISYRCRSCGREYRDIEEILSIWESDR